MSEFKKGQLVAVNCPAEDDRQWHLRIFKEKRPDGHFVAEDDKREVWAWQVCRPAEEVWSDIFLGRERRAGEQAAGTVAMESELVQRLKRQIEWLCSNPTGALNEVKLCPPNARCDGRVECEDCWSFAAEIATEDAKDE